MSTALITKTREESKAIVSRLPNALRVECDKVFAAGETLIKSADETARVLSIALSHIAADEKAVEKAQYKTFKDLAADVFGIKPAQATQFRKVGDKFYCAEKPPICSEWFTASKLYELRSVDSKILDEDAGSGLLRPDMTQAQLRDYAASKSLTDGAEVVKLFDIHIYTKDGESAFTGSEDDIYEALFDAVEAEDAERDRVAHFNPHATLVKEAKGKTPAKEVKGKGLVIVYGTRVAHAVYFSTDRAKTAPSEETIAAQNKTIEALMAEIAALKAERNA